MHDGPPMHRRSNGNAKVSWLQPFESAEHQAGIFAAAFLINDTAYSALSSIEEISIRFGISLESASIYFSELTDQREKEKNAERVQRIAQQLKNDFKIPLKPSNSTIRYIDDVCPTCGNKTVFPIGIKFMCATCDNVSDRFQDGDCA
jgi:Zn-dependent peptidase ImmA (M78 family)